MSGSFNLNILMTTDTVGGVWTYSCALASALAASGAEVHLVTLGPRTTAGQRTMLSDRRVQIIETDLALEWQDPEGRDVANARRFLARLEADIRPDVIHLNSFREASFEWRAPTLVVTHSCVNSWALACKEVDWLTEPRWQRYTQAVADGLNRTDAWVSPTRAFYDVVADLYRPCSPGTVIWNGIAPRPTCPHKQDFVFAAGRLWDRAKNIGLLSEAAVGLQWPVLVAGADDGAAQSGATWLGALAHSSVLARMHRAAIFASPALYEPFGLSVLEAAAAGCALVLSDIRTFRELWSDAAVFIDPTDGRALAQTLAALCTEHDKRAELQRAAYERSFGYSLSRMTSAYLRLYEALHKPSAVETQPMEVRA